MEYFRPFHAQAVRYWPAILGILHVAFLVDEASLEQALLWLSSFNCDSAIGPYASTTVPRDM
jgi:hypothetical protein